MKRYKNILIIALLCITSCSGNDTSLEFIFPIGSSVNDIMSEDVLSSKMIKSEYLTEEDLKDELHFIYGVDKYGAGAMKITEENFSPTDENLKNITALHLYKYVKDGVRYDDILLFFHNNILVQVCAITKDKLIIPKSQTVTNNFKGVTKNSTIIYYYSKMDFYDEPKEMPYSRFNNKRTIFEMPMIENVRDYFYYTYYTYKVCPLAGINFLN